MMKMIVDVLPNSLKVGLTSQTEPGQRNKSPGVVENKSEANKKGAEVF